jgi:uncharacterized protein (TIGR03067 family)
MRMLLLALGVTFLATFSGQAADDKKEKKFDAADLVGVWKITEGTKMGNKVDAAAMAGKVTFTKDTITIKDDTATHVMKYKLNEKGAPIAITMTGDEGPAKGMVAEGIIAVDGETLKLAYSMPGEKAPKEFKSEEKSQTFNFVLKKVVEEKKK